MEKDAVKKLREDPTYLLRVCEGLEQLRVGNKNDIRQSQTEAYLGGNKVVSDLNKYLFSFTTVLIPVIFSLLSVTEIMKSLDKFDGLLIQLALVFLFSSLLAGLLHMVAEYKFFDKWLKNQNSKLKLWSSTSFWPSAPIPSKIEEYITEYDSMKKQADDIEDEMQNKSYLTNLIMQCVLSLTGILFLIITIFRILP